MLLKKIDEYLSVKSDLDNMGVKKIITSERIDEMCRILTTTFINCPSEKQRVAKLRSLRERICTDIREFEAMAGRKDKIPLTRINEALESIRQSCIKMDEKKVQLEKRMHIASQLLRIAKSPTSIDVERLVE